MTKKTLICDCGEEATYVAVIYDRMSEDFSYLAHCTGCKESAEESKKFIFDLRDYLEFCGFDKID